MSHATVEHRIWQMWRQFSFNTAKITRVLRSKGVKISEPEVDRIVAARIEREYRKARAG